MAVEIANSGKKIKFECIDPMCSTPNYELSQKQNPEEWQGYSAKEFHERLKSVENFYTLHQMSSDDAVNLYEDGSIDFLLIDGDHSYEGVKKDIINYLPKMRSGGLIVGDDAFVPEIAQAAQDAAGYLNPVFNGIHFFINVP